MFERSLVLYKFTLWALEIDPPVPIGNSTIQDVPHSIF